MPGADELGTHLEMIALLGRESQAEEDSVSAAVRAFDAALESIFARFVKDIIEHARGTE